MFRKLILLIVSVIGCYSSAAFSVGLGEAEIKSGLNQQLNAKIILLSAGELAEHELVASLGSANDFEKFGIDRLFFLSDIRFKTVKDENGNLIIKLSTRQPIKEPFLNILVELNWPNGRSFREYTFLLDPPIFEESTSSTIQKTEVSSSKQAEPKAPQTRYIAPAQSTTSSFSGSSYGPVSSTDTLWSIANKTRPNSQVSIHQTLVAIYRANPQAFADGNINNLLRGQVLQIPDADVISLVPHRAALQDVVTQNRQWQSGGARRIVGADSQSSASGESSGEARFKLASPEDKYSEGNATSGEQAVSREAQQKLVQAQEKSATLQAENDELRARLADVLQKLENVDSGSAINISDTELAVLTQPKESSIIDDVEDELTIADNQSELDTEVLTEVNDLMAEAETASNTVSETTIAESGVADTKLAETSQKTVDLVAEQPTFTPAPKEDSFFESSSTLWGGGLLAVGLIAVGVFWRMRKRMEEEDFQDDLVASAGSGSMDTTETFELPDVGDDMLVELDMDDAGEEIAESDDENFDPLGEADIYIAYGKYEQAETLLLEAIDDNPIRSDLKVKLMECYAESENKDKFDTLAEEVSQAVDADEWTAQIDAMRAQAWSSESQSDDGFDLPSTEDIFGEEDNDFESQLDSMMDDDESKAQFAESESFSLDEESDSEDEFDIDMSIGEVEAEDSIIESEAVTETFDAIDDEEFGLDLEGEDELELDDSNDISLDLDDEDFSFEDDDESAGDADEDDGGDEISTKLDLARAYVDMGDSDGAKEILAEVIAEGSDTQKQEAQALLAKAD